MLKPLIRLIRITAPHYCAGVELGPDGRVIQTAPILSWARGKRGAQLENYCIRKGYAYEFLIHDGAGWAIIGGQWGPSGIALT